MASQPPHFVGFKKVAPGMGSAVLFDLPPNGKARRLRADTILRGFHVAELRLIVTFYTLFQWLIGIPTPLTAGGDNSLPIYERIARRSRVNCVFE